MLRYTLVPELINGFTTDDPFFKILLAIPSDGASLCCGREFSELNPEAVGLARERGVDIKIDSYGEINSRTVIPAYPDFKEDAMKKAMELRSKGARFLFYHGQPETIFTVPGRGEYYFYDCETQLICSVVKGQFALDEKGIPEIGMTPDGGEAAVSGVLRDYGAALKNEDKKVLQNRLAAELGVEFDSSRALVVFDWSPRLDRVLAVKCLHGLAADYNVLIKNCPAGDLNDLNVKNFFVDKREDKNSAALSRYAADVLVADMFSAEFVLAAMRGLRVIPVYTPLMFSDNNADSLSFIFELKQYRHVISSLALEILVPSLIDDSGSIAGKINDAEYWAKYDSLIKEIQFYAFGRYMFDDDALARAANLVTRLVQYESLITPAAQQKMINTPVQRSFTIKKGL